jgi:hypothetical protein
MANPFVGYDNIVPLVAPVAGTTGTITSPYVDLRNAQKASFLIAFGAITSTTTTDEMVITVECATAEGGAEAAIAYRYRLSAAVGANTWGAVTTVAAGSVCDSSTRYPRSTVQANYSHFGNGFCFCLVHRNMSYSSGVTHTEIKDAGAVFPPLRSLAIVGSHPDSREKAPFDDPNYEIFLFNEAPQKTEIYKRWDTSLQIHKPEVYTSETNWVNKDHWKWLQQDHGPDKRIFMQEADPRVPNSVRYPIEGVRIRLKVSGHLYLTNIYVQALRWPWR